ncbi:hypothetical protein ACIQF6_06240 [Kitasatospora sp. NPDC092948]
MTSTRTTEAAAVRAAPPGRPRLARVGPPTDAGGAHGRSDRPNGARSAAG